MNKPFSSAEVISAVGIRLAELRQCVTDSQLKAAQQNELFGAQLAAMLAEAREEIAALRAWRAEAALQLATLVGPAGPPGDPGPAGPSADETVAPDDLVRLIGLATAMLNESSPLAGHGASPPVVVNAVPPPRRKTITTRRDAEGNLSAEVVEHE